MHLEAEIQLNSEMDLEAMIERVLRCIWRPRSCNSEMHLEAVIERVWRCIWRPRSCNSEMRLEAVFERVWRCIRRPWSSNSEMHLEAVIERVWRCTWRPRSCNSEMHLEALIERVWRCIWRPWPSNSEIHLETVIERVWRCTCRPRSMWTQRCTWRPWSREFGDALGGHDRSTLEEYLEVVDLEAVDREGGFDGRWDSIHWLTRNCGNVENWVQTGWERETVNHGIMQYAVYAILSACCTRCMLYSVLTLDHGMQR